jgi:hypothetical protein
LLHFCINNYLEFEKLTDSEPNGRRRKFVTPPPHINPPKPPKLLDIHIPANLDDFMRKNATIGSRRPPPTRTTKYKQIPPPFKRLPTVNVYFLP